MSAHRMTLTSFRLSRKNLGNLREFFGQMVHPPSPPGKKNARTPMTKACRTVSATLQQNKNYKKLALLFNVRLHPFFLNQAIPLFSRPTQLFAFSKKKRLTRKIRTQSTIFCLTFNLKYRHIVLSLRSHTDFQSFPFHYKENVSLSHRRS